MSGRAQEARAQLSAIAEADDEPARSAVRFAFAAGLSAGALTLGVIGVPSWLAFQLGVNNSFSAAPILLLAAAVAGATGSWRSSRNTRRGLTAALG